MLQNNNKREAPFMDILYKNIPIYYTDQGKGNVLVLLHGYTESSEIWTDFALELSKEFRVITIDLPGHGRSGMVAEVHTMELMAEVVKTVLTQLNVNRCAIVGHSMGGYVTLAFVRKYASMVMGMGLFHSSSLADSDEVKYQRERTIEIIKSSHHKFLNGFIPELFAEENRDKFKTQIEKLIHNAEKMSPEALISAQEGMRQRTSTLDVLINANCPVLFIAGQKDSRVPFENVWVQMALTNITHALIMKNVGHMGYLEAYSETLHAVRSFTQSVYNHSR